MTDDQHRQFGKEVKRFLEVGILIVPPILLAATLLAWLVS